MRYLVTGGAGFIGSHLTDYLLSLGHEVTVIDNLRSGLLEQVNKQAEFVRGDILNTDHLKMLMQGCDGVFHLAAIARTPWCMDDPLLACRTNIEGTVSVLESARRAGGIRTLLSSSNVVLAAATPYRMSKESGEGWGKCYAESYGLPVVSLRYSNVYGKRQAETGPSPNVFAAFRKCIREKGYAEVTGDGEQTRDFTHVSDINRAQFAAMDHGPRDGTVIDLCTGRNVSMNYVVRDLFKSPIRYIPERHGDVKHIRQNPEWAWRRLAWAAKVRLEEGIGDVL